MKTGVRLFLSSMTFGAVVATLYGYFTRDVFGTFMLGMMTVALAIVALYIAVAERDAHLEADDPASSPQRLAGETIGIFSLESYWPPILALAVVLVALGALYLPGFSGTIFLVGALLLAWVLRFLIREST